MTTAFEDLVSTTKPKMIKMIAEGKVGARLVTYENGVQAVMKVAEAVTPKRGKSAPHGIPVVSIPRREVAFYKLSGLMGFSVVPETVLAIHDDRPVSFQRFVNAAKLYDLEPDLKDVSKEDSWSVAFRKALRRFPERDVAHLTVLDFLACSRDRHGANYGARLSVGDEDSTPKWRLLGWDNGESFGLTMSRYHCVAHRYLYTYTFPLDTVLQTLAKLDYQAVRSSLVMLSEEESKHVWYRMQFMLEYPQRLPWFILSKGSETPKEFPSYTEHFRPVLADDPIAKTRYVLRHAKVPG